MASRISRRVLAAAACGSLLVLLTAGTAAATPKHKQSGRVVVVSGLNNPRQLSLVHNGVLLIAEAGKGGDVATGQGPEGTLGLGYTGSVSAVWTPALAHDQQPHRIVTGLLSGASAAPDEESGLPAGSFATGPDGVSARLLNRIGIIETTFEPFSPDAAKPFDGHLLLASPDAPISPLADISGFEAAHDPDGQGVVSNPYGVLVYREGWLVADAAGNTVYRVGHHGDVTVFHVFPNVTTGACVDQVDPSPEFPGCNFVPTSLAADPAGDVYVGGLSSLTPGEAQVVKLNSSGHVLQVWRGFTSVSGLALGHDGSLYVSQLFAEEANPPLPQVQGVVTRIKGDSRTSMDVPFAAGVAVDAWNNVYVSAFSILPETGAGIPGLDTSGQVWRIRF
jgi:hypothetical protein